MKPASVLLVLATLLLVAGCDQDDALHLDRVEPAVVAPGSQLLVQGAGFCGATADCRPPAMVSLGERMVVVRDDTLTWQEQELRFVVPEETAPGAGFLVVTVDGEASNAVELEVVAGAGLDR